MWPLLKSELNYNRSARASDDVSLGGLVTMDALTIALVCLLGIRTDLRFVPGRPHRRIIELLAGVVIAGIIGVFFYLKIMSRRNYELYAAIRDYFFHSPFVAVVAILLCAGLIHAGATVYARRHSYLA